MSGSVYVRKEDQIEEKIRGLEKKVRDLENDQDLLRRRLAALETKPAEPAKKPRRQRNQAEIK